MNVNTLKRSGSKPGRRDPTPLVRIAVTPPRKIRLSLDGRLDGKAAVEECAAAGLPESLLHSFQAVVRHTHHRINSVVLELPAEKLGALKAQLDQEKMVYEDIQTVFPLRRG